MKREKASTVLRSVSLQVNVVRRLSFVVRPLAACIPYLLTYSLRCRLLVTWLYYLLLLIKPVYSTEALK